MESLICKLGIPFWLFNYQYYNLLSNQRKLILKIVGISYYYIRKITIFAGIYEDSLYICQYYIVLLQLIYLFYQVINSYIILV